MSDDGLRQYTDAVGYGPDFTNYDRRYSVNVDDTKATTNGWEKEPLAYSKADEPESTGTAPDSECKKFATGAKRSNDDAGLRYDLISRVGLRRLAARYALGAVRYGEENWRHGFPFSSVANHMHIHFEKWKDGDTSDDNLAAIAWGAFTLMDYEENNPEMDDRWSTRKERGK